ncbi:MAG: hypothetical protein HF314_17765 [Ignavibacteria bacterium]|jgi:hypothetical protein|nr:hypothetical protein [Ignavibacteria bacterium]MCU7504935.1 hypothetical protein [Ignavibacteria bacterium]MCU7518406.1 hypothetical protein [Ignavibacteria bacterium]
MRHIFLAILLFTAFAFTGLEAQDANSRFQKQHNITTFMKSHLTSSIEMTARALENKEFNMKVSALQTIRQLEQLFPEESFSRLIEPLATIINDKNTETETRILAAITLDQLHTDKGDEAIFLIGQNCENSTVKNLCQAITRIPDDTFINASQVK